MHRQQLLRVPLVASSEISSRSIHFFQASRQRLCYQKLFPRPSGRRSLSRDHNLSQMQINPVSLDSCLFADRSLIQFNHCRPMSPLATERCAAILQQHSVTVCCCFTARSPLVCFQYLSPSPSSPTPCSSPGRRSQTRPARCTQPTRTARRWRRASRRSRGGTTRRRRHPRRGARRRRPTFPRRRVRLLPARRSRAGTGALLSSRTVFHPSIERKHGPAGSLSIQYRSLLSAASSKLQGCCASASIWHDQPHQRLSVSSSFVVSRVRWYLRQYPYA